MSYVLSEYDYIIQKYSELEILEKDENEMFNFNIYPNKKQFNIPKCSVCNEDYNNFKSSINQTEVIMNHQQSCLWYEYYISRIKNINIDVKILKKKRTTIFKK